MRHLPKPPDSKAAAYLRNFIDAQLAARVTESNWQVFPIDYKRFPGTSVLCSLLVEEQKGLCAYTGVGLDDRLVARAPGGLVPPRTDYSFKPHNEHLKSQRQCREELVEKCGVVGRDEGEDMAYTNLVAALEVSGNPAECFGAAFRGDKEVPVLPTNPACTTGFLYTEDGGILGLIDEATATVSVLRLDHASLVGWRCGAIKAFLPDGEKTPREDLQEIVAALEDDARSTLPEFSFVVAQVARDYLRLQRAEVTASSPPAQIRPQIGIDI